VRSTAHLLARVSPAHVATEPFAHIVRSSVLPAREYATLAEQFPPLAVIAENAPPLGSNVAVRMSAVRALARSDVSSEWQRFFEYYTSGDYWLEVVSVVGSHLRAAFPTLEARIGRRFEDWRVARRGSSDAADVRLDCQFVRNTPVTKRSSVKTAHVDQYDKIFSALLYMREPHDLAGGGDLDLYRWRRPPRFVKHRVLSADVQRVKTIPYASNTYVAFVNSPQSVHGVSPRDATESQRRYVNFIAEIPVPAFEPIQVNLWDRWRHGRRNDG
jgi:hypothetical protein